MTGGRKGKAQAGDGRLTIGFITLNLSQEQAADVWSGAVDAARERDANLVCLPGEGGQGVRSVLYDLVPAENLDGLVTFQWWSSRQAFEEVYERYRPLPVVNVMRLYEGYPGVAWDNRQVTYDLVSHLIEVHGYRRIAYIGLFQENVVAQERYQAYVDALAEHGIPLDPDLVMPADYSGPNLSGTRGVSYLLDDRGLQPGKDFEAVVPYNDGEALQVLDALRARGIEVPYDVSVVGIDDLRQSAVSAPPLTTVAMPTREMGERAVEMLLARLAGGDMPEQVVMPSPLIARASCGCMNPVALQAMASVEACSEETTFAVALAAQRDVVVGEIRQAAGQDCDRLDDDWAERLLDAFAGSVGGDLPASVAPEEGFLSTLSQFLESTSVAGRDVVSWQNVISAMRRHLLLCFGDAGRMSRAESLWGQARVLVGEAMRRVEARQGLQAAQRAQQLRQVGTALAAATDVEQLADILAQELPQLGIPSCYFALYEDPTAPAEWSRLVLAYDERGRAELEAGGRRLPSRRLASEDTLGDRRHSIVVEPLYFQEEHLGFVLFEVGPTDGNVYPSLASEISGTLRGVLLAREQQRLREESDEARRQLEVALTDLRAAQARYLRQAWEGYGASAEAIKGYVVSQEGLGATADAWLSPMTDAVQHRGAVVEDTEMGSMLGLPVMLGGQVIGVLGFSREGNGEWAEGEIADAQAVVAQMAQALENQRLLGEELQARIALDEQVKALDCLNDIGRRMEQAPPIPEFLQWVAGRIPSAMRHADVCLVAVEYGGEAYGSPEALEEPRQIVQGMRIGGELVGRVCIAYTKEYEFLDEESALLGDIARRVSGYVESQRLLEETRTNAEEFAVLYELGRSLTGQLDTDQVLEEIYRGVSRLMDATNFYVGLYDPERRQITFPLNVTESVIDRHITTMSVDEGLTGYVVRTGESLLIAEDVVGWMRTKGIGTVGEAAQSWLGVPLLVGDQVQGVMAVQNYATPHAYTEADQNRLVALASQASVALQNARLFDQIQLRARREQILREITARVRSSTDPDIIVRTAVRELGTALGRRTFVRLGSVEDLSEGGE